jgi:PIN domain nuclease of toxin-antitoxin system
MRLLLDTQVVLWQLAGERSLSGVAREAIAEADDLLFSVTSFAEIGIKAAIGKLVIPETLNQQVTGAGLRILGLSAEHGLAVAKLPVHHRDPFDRLLIAQAITDGLTVVTADGRFPQYGVPVIDAE